MLSNQFIKTLAPILDWSSILNESSFIFKNLQQQSDSTKVQMEYLAHHSRNKPFKWKCEVSQIKKQSPVECEIFPLVSFPPSAHLAFFFLLCHLPRPATPTSPTPPQASPAQLSQPQPSPTSPASQAKKLKKTLKPQSAGSEPFSYLLIFFSPGRWSSNQVHSCVLGQTTCSHCISS